MLAVDGDLVVLLGVKHHLLICPLGKLVVGVIERSGVHLGLMTLMHVGGVGRSVLVETGVVGSVGWGPGCLLLLHRVWIRLLLEVERELLAGLLGHRGGMVDRIRRRGVLLPGRGLISGRRGIHSLRGCWKMPVLSSENSHGLWGEKKRTELYQRGCGKNIRKTGGKSEERGHNLQEEKLQGKVAVEMQREPEGKKRTRWGVRIMGGDGSTLYLNKDGRRLRGRRRRLGHPTM